MNTLLECFDFKNKKLLKRALTNRSYSVEHKLSYDNQRLEFLGDAVIEIVVTDYLYHRYVDYNEGKLTTLRAIIVRKSSLAKLALYIGLDKKILLGKGDKKNNGYRRVSTLCDSFEALIGAIYLDSGIDKCHRILISLIEKVFIDLEKYIDSLNPKGKLQEISERYYKCKPIYRVKKVIGPEHNLTYFVEAIIDDKAISVGKGCNIKKAEHNAALQALNNIRLN